MAKGPPGKGTKIAEGSGAKGSKGAEGAGAKGTKGDSKDSVPPPSQTRKK